MVTQKDVASASEPFLFDQNDFDQVFIPGVVSAPAVQAAPPWTSNNAQAAFVGATTTPAPAGAWGTHAEPPFDVERIDAPAAAPAGKPGQGILLTSGKATVLSIVWIVTLLAAFGIGLTVGLMMQPPAAGTTEEPAAAAQPAEGTR